MNPCSTYQETLWLDVYGELAERERPAWEKHLESCAGCRQEKEALLRVLEKAKDALIVPLPSPSPVEQVRATWDRKVARHAERAWWTKLLVPVPVRPLPALATVLLLVALGAWGAATWWERPPVPSGSQFVSAPPLTPEEFAVIKDLRILREMETIERLVQVLDKPQTLEPEPEEETTHDRKNRTENT